MENNVKFTCLSKGLRQKYTDFLNSFIPLVRRETGEWCFIEESKLNQFMKDYPEYVRVTDAPGLLDLVLDSLELSEQTALSQGRIRQLAPELVRRNLARKKSRFSIFLPGATEYIMNREENRGRKKENKKQEGV